MIRLSFALLLLYSCTDQPPTTPETRPVENPNAGNTAIYDVDADDPYEMGTGTFLDMSPGSELAPFSKILREEEQGRYQIKGRRGNELGYILSPDGSTIGSIHITSTDVVTQDGLRVGNTYNELVERIGKPTSIDQGDGRTCLRMDQLTYCLDTVAQVPQARITEISIQP